MRKGCICEGKGFDWESTIETFAITLVLAGMFVLMHAVMFTMNSLAIRWRTKGNLSWKAIQNRKCKCPYHKTVQPTVLSLVENREKRSEDSERVSEGAQEETVAESTLAAEVTQQKELSPSTQQSALCTPVVTAAISQDVVSSDQCSTSIAHLCISQPSVTHKTSAGMHSI